MTSARRSSKGKRAAKRSGTRGAAPKPSRPDGARRNVVVATSGGPDSAAALLLAREAMPGDRLYAAYIDHGLRPAAHIKEDIKCVRDQARHARAEVIVRRIKIARRGKSLEAAARTQRYRALGAIAGEVGASVVITGHHRDDVVETMLLALSRGSGIDGTSAMAAKRSLAPGVTLLRPLLRYGKSELREFIRAAGVPAAADETNENLSLRRNAIRALLRDLERLVPGANRAMARSATLLGDDKALLESLAAAAWKRALVDERATALATQTLRTLPPALLRRTIRHAVKHSLGTLKDFHFEHCDSIAQAIAQGSGGTFHAGGGRVELSAGRMTVIPADGAVEFIRPSVVVVPKAKQTARDDTGRIELRHATKPKRGSDVTVLDADALPAGTKLTVRTPREGDRCRPGGRRHAVSLARFLAKSGIPKHRRRHVLVLCRDDEIVAVVGVRVMEPYVAHGKRALLCQFRGTA